MAINWSEYELVLEENSSKECEVTGRDMGGTKTFTCPVSALTGDELPRWTSDSNYRYGGYQAYTFYFLRTDDEAIYLYTDKFHRQEIRLQPNEIWSSGWYSFGEWSYCVRLQVRKKQTNEK